MVYSQVVFLVRAPDWVASVTKNLELANLTNTRSENSESISTLCYNFSVELLQHNDIAEALKMLDLMANYYSKINPNETKNVKDVVKRFFCRAQIYFRKNEYSSAINAVKDIFTVFPINVIDLNATLQIFVASSMYSIIKGNRYAPVHTLTKTNDPILEWSIYEMEIEFLEQYAASDSAKEAKLVYLESIIPNLQSVNLLKTRLIIAETKKELGRFADALSDFDSICQEIELGTLNNTINGQILLARAKAESAVIHFDSKSINLEVGFVLDIWQNLLHGIPVYHFKSKSKNTFNLSSNDAIELCKYLSIFD